MEGLGSEDRIEGQGLGPLSLSVDMLKRTFSQKKEVSFILDDVKNGRFVFGNYTLVFIRLYIYFPIFISTLYCHFILFYFIFLFHVLLSSSHNFRLLSMLIYIVTMWWYWIQMQRRMIHLREVETEEADPSKVKKYVSTYIYILI